MNNPSLFITALVTLPAAGVLLWAWRTYARSDLRVDAGLEQADLHIGTWPSSRLGSAT
jgi:hypothetical protein